MESQPLRIVKPIGNRQSRKFFKCEDLRKRFARDIRAHQREELSWVMGKSSVRKNRTIKKFGGKEPPLARYNKGRGYRLRLLFKGKYYRGRLKRDGRILVSRKIYNSPSLASVAIKKRSSNGWIAWEYERAPGDWVKLKELRR